jgi:hypothetical protein
MNKLSNSSFGTDLTEYLMDLLDKAFRSGWDRRRSLYRRRAAHASAYLTSPVPAIPIRKE